MVDIQSARCAADYATPLGSILRATSDGVNLDFPMSNFVIHLENFLQALVTGIMIGCLYGLMCTGLGMIFGIMRVINFAQGD